MKSRVFVGTYTGGRSEGIYSAVFEDGALTVHGATQAVNPSYLAVHGDRLYAVEETWDGAIVSYTAEGLALSPDGRQKRLGDDPCHIFLDGERLYVSNYTSGSLASFCLAHGRVVGPPVLFEHEGGSVDAVRQRSAHVHQAMLTPDGQYLAVCDLGIDKVLFYPHDEEGIHAPAQEVCVPKGAGPRHAAFGRDGMWYVVCELSCDVLVYRGHGKAAKLLQKLSTLRAGEKGACAALKLSPDGLWLAASTRGANTLTLFRVLEDGTLKESGQYDVQGDCPRDIAFSPDGHYVLCALERSDAITIFHLANGTLSYGGSVEIPSPTCVCFA